MALNTLFSPFLPPHLPPQESLTLPAAATASHASFFSSFTYGKKL